MRMGGLRILLLLLLAGVARAAPGKPADSHPAPDGSNPAHTSIHYNGWTGPNPNGYATDKRFHGRFESAYVGANINTMTC